MIRTTRWTPDTCGCTLEYQWDDAVPESSRTHTLSRVVTACPAHATLPSDAARYDAAVDENSTKNQAKAEILAKVAALAATVINPDGSSFVDFRNPPTVTFGLPYVGKGRSLTVTVPGITAPQRAAAQAALDAKFGVGKVVVG